MKKRALFSSICLSVLLSYTASSQIYRIAVVPEETKTCGYIDLKGATIVQPLCSHCFDYTGEGTAITANKKFSKIELVDENGKIIIPETEIHMYFDPWLGIPVLYSGGILRTKENGKWGGFDHNGKIAIQFIYDELTDFNDGHALSKKNGSYYVLDIKGNETLIEGFEITYIKHFSEGLAPVEVKGELYGFVDVFGKVVISPQFKGVGYFYGEYAWARNSKNDIGFINKNGQWIVEPQFKFVGNFDEVSGLAMVKDNPSQTKGKYVDESGAIRTFDMTEETFDFSEGLAIGKKADKYGYLNNKGEWEIAPIFDEAHNFINGYAAVKLDKGWGLIDKNANSILPPVYKHIGDVAKIE
jgi:hypothetical protein